MTFSRPVCPWVQLLVHTGIGLLLALWIGLGGIEPARATHSAIRGAPSVHRIDPGMTPFVADRWALPVCDARVLFCWMQPARAAFLCASDSALESLGTAIGPWAPLTGPLSAELRRTAPDAWWRQRCHTRQACHVCWPGGQILYASR